MADFVIPEEKRMHVLRALDKVTAFSGEGMTLGYYIVAADIMRTLKKAEETPVPLKPKALKRVKPSAAQE